MNLSRNADELFDTPVNKIYWYFKSGSQQLLAFRDDVNIFTRQGMPQSSGKIKPNSIFVIDDQIDGDFIDIFTRWTHHFFCFCVKITQNYYHKSKDRTSNLCAQYLALFKFPFDRTIIHSLANQMRKPLLVDAYEDAVRKEYGYIFINLHQTTKDFIRVKTNILPGEGMLTVFRM